jgi:uncharacterized membrane protein
MMTARRLSRLDMLTLAMGGLFLLIAAWIMVAGPSGPMPMHFDARGVPDRWGDRSELAGLLVFMAVMAVGLGLPMGWYARRSEDPARARGLIIGQVVNLICIGATTAFILTLTLGHAYGGFQPGSGWLMAGFGALIAAIGALLGRVAPNPIIGVRTPWAYKSRLAWDRSNRLAGRLFFLLGLGGMVAAPFSPHPMGLMVLVGAMMVAAIWSVVESWRVWRTDPDRQPF